MRLILTRHGETIENKKGISQGHIPGKLSKEGIKQAKKLALRLKDEEIDFIFSSDLARAKDTTKEIIKYHPDVPVKFVKELRERYLGKLQGKKNKEDVWKDKKLTKGIETPKHMCSRIKKFLDKVLLKHKKDTVLFVAHGGTSRALMTVITGEDPKEMFNLGKLSNTGVGIIEIKGKKHKIRVFNCTKHLD
ncbi:MAG: histidine phosphatase family protein [Candidatus Nanoarchaeia archaeon]|nr:histidine phosphatase family protein [Candidatus Nanoarchaeia archaeon]